MDIRKHVKYLIVRNPLYEIGLKDIIVLKILHEKTENLYEKEVVVCFGDYEQKEQMKYKEATKGKGMRTLFRKASFQTYLVDEFRTSCRCSKCEIGICEKNMVMENPRPNYLSRSNNSSGFLEEFPKSKFTCLEIGKPCCFT